MVPDGPRREHVPERVTLLYSRLPAKAVATGEPTYENTTYLGNAVGWWQGHEAWSNLCSGATMGVGLAFLPAAPSSSLAGFGLG